MGTTRLGTAETTVQTHAALSAALEEEVRCIVRDEMARELARRAVERGEVCRNHEDRRAVVSGIAGGLCEECWKAQSTAEGEKR